MNAINLSKQLQRLQSPVTSSSLPPAPAPPFTPSAATSRVSRSCELLWGSLRACLAALWATVRISYCPRKGRKQTAATTTTHTVERGGNQQVPLNYANSFHFSFAATSRIRHVVLALKYLKQYNMEISRRCNTLTAATWLLLPLLPTTPPLGPSSRHHPFRHAIKEYFVNSSQLLVVGVKGRGGCAAVNAAGSTHTHTHMRVYACLVHSPPSLCRLLQLLPGLLPALLLCLRCGSWSGSVSWSWSWLGSGSGSLLAARR